MKKSMITFDEMPQLIKCSLFGVSLTIPITDQHIINQFVRKRLTFPDSPYIIIRVFEVEFSIVDSDVFSEWIFIDS